MFSGLRRLTMEVVEVEPGICYYASESVDVTDLQQQSTSSMPVFLNRGFPCNAASDPVNFDVINGGYSPLNEVFIYAQNVHNAWMDWVGRPPLSSGARDNPQFRKIKGKFLCTHPSVCPSIHWTACPSICLFVH